jgi:hypothetical protein
MDSGLAIPVRRKSAVTIDDLVRYDNLQTDIAILSFSKAFDTVPHNKLLLWHLHQLIKNFLCYRKMNMSSDVHVAAGVPKGTVLGPLLFLSHI